MDNKEFMQYLKDAIDQETAIVQQQELIEQVTAQESKKKPEPPLLENDLEAPELVKYSLPDVLVVLMVIGYSLTGVFPFLAFFIFSSFPLVCLEFFAIFLAMGLVPTIVYNVTNNNNKTRYEAELREYTSKVQRIKTNNKRAEEEYQINKHEWETSFRELKERVSKPLEESKALIVSFYSNDVIYPKYRNLPALTSFYEYFMTGRCTELTGPHGAYNLYENELRQDMVVNKLSVIAENLEQIRMNQYMLYQQMSAIQENTKVIAAELQAIEGYTIRIAELTAMNNYYAALTEMNTRLSLAYSLCS